MRYLRKDHTLRWQQGINSVFLAGGCVLSSFSRVGLFGTPWTVACQAPLNSWDSPGKNIGVGWHDLFQGIFPNRDQTGIFYMSFRQAGSLPLAPLGKPIPSWYTGPKVTKSPLEIRKQASINPIKSSFCLN